MFGRFSKFNFWTMLKQRTININSNTARAKPRTVGWLETNLSVDYVVQFRSKQHRFLFSVFQTPRHRRSWACRRSGSWSRSFFWSWAWQAWSQWRSSASAGNAPQPRGIPITRTTPRLILQSASHVSHKKHTRSRLYAAHSPSCVVAWSLLGRCSMCIRPSVRPSGSPLDYSPFPLSFSVFRPFDNEILCVSRVVRESRREERLGKLQNDFLDPLNYKRIENAGGGGQAFGYFLFSRFFVPVRLRLLEKQENRELLVGKSRCPLSKELQIARRKLSKVNSAKM